VAPQFTTVTSCLTAAEAESICGLLRSEGIPATLADGSLNTVDPLLGPALGYVRVDVPRDLLEKARAILEERVRKPGGSADDACPACGAPLPGESSCAACGWALADGGEEEAWAPRPPSPPPRRGVGFGWLALAVFAAVSILAETAQSVFNPIQGDAPDWTPTLREVPGLVIGVLLLAGGVFLAVTQGVRGRLRPNRATAGVIAQGMGLGLLLDLVLMRMTMSGALPTFGTVDWFLVPFMGSALAVAWPALRGAGLRRTRAALGLVRGKGFLREAAIGAAAFPAVHAAEVLCDWVLQPGPRPHHGIYDWLLAEEAWFRWWGIAAVLVQTPIVEELIFRGAIYRFLRNSSGIAVSVVLSSLLFAVCHMQGWGAIPYLAVFGASAALLREWRGSLVAPMALHAAAGGHNLALLALNYW